MCVFVIIVYLDIVLNADKSTFMHEQRNRWAKRRFRHAASTKIKHVYHRSHSRLSLLHYVLHLSPTQTRNTSCLCLRDTELTLVIDDVGLGEMRGFSK